MEWMLRLVSLVPHRDYLQPLPAIKDALFSAGFPGAYSFPPVVPLALVSRPFSPDELKVIAASLRHAMNENVSNGKFTPAEMGVSSAGGKLDGLSVFGPVLNIPAAENWFPAQCNAEVTAFFDRFVLACALLSPLAPENAPQFQVTPFRSAAIANLVLEPLGCGDPRYSFSWKTGKLHWLPKE
ncbi:hypothetical protein FACS1894151_08030 [Spirochaetia bacterium]|nr:hypothetical protein FACS1894151_08030 [Spirochaetia bacterium]